MFNLFTYSNGYSNGLFVRVIRHLRALTAVIILSMLTISTASIAQEWTLQTSIQQAVSNSALLQHSAAEIGSKQADANLSRLWPDPEIGFRIDNKLGQDDGAGGYDLTDITISQPIPISRLKHQGFAAEASLKAAELSLLHKKLTVENRVSKSFHRLQFSSAQLALAEQQLALADKS